MWLQTRCMVCLRPSMPLAQGPWRAVRPDSRVVLRWACLCDAAHPQDFSDRKDIEVFYSQDFREPEGTYRDYGLLPPPARRRSAAAGPAGVAVGRVLHRDRPLRVRRDMGQRPRRQGNQLLVGTQERCRAGGIPTRLNDGTMQLLKMAERQLCDGEIQVFPTESYGQGHALHHAASGIYTPKELMEMDWLEECVEANCPATTNWTPRPQPFERPMVWTS